MAVVNVAIEGQQDRPCDSSGNTVLSNLFQDLAIKLIDGTTDMLSSAINDVAEPMSAELEETAVSVTRCIRNVIWSTSCTIQTTGTSEEKIGSSKVEGIWLINNNVKYVVDAKLTVTFIIP
ncbi:hypothetical protein OS493_022310 [Desmophyllum pertusum]|uniref:Uncharacterized protein n=1 Tax=Desmophyllum pertusum TaxID=174260 RepID=A0A9W9ZZR7_9CNID|nr:hypothetical protein OS493_022310 [Desmophyllum pertusum]